MPATRDYGSVLKPNSSSHFEIHQNDSGQFCVVLNHALLRGVSAEMIHWWFLNCTRLLALASGGPSRRKVVVTLGPGDVAQPGCSIHIREAMQYERYGWKHPVDSQLKVVYVGPDGWAMGKMLPLIGPVIRSMPLEVRLVGTAQGRSNCGNLQKGFIAALGGGAIFMDQVTRTTINRSPSNRPFAAGANVSTPRDVKVRTKSGHCS